MNTPIVNIPDFDVLPVLRPILFSSRMVNAILAGQKTQTRRIIKDQDAVEYHEPTGDYIHVHSTTCPGYCDYACHYPCPYGRAGDLLWGRETFTVWNGGELVYRADCIEPDGNEKESVREARLHYGVKWRPSIFMPKTYSRITLKIAEIEVERLTSISDQDVKSEGFTDRDEMIATWNMLHGPTAWNSNPWVWVVKF